MYTWHGAKMNSQAHKFIEHFNLQRTQRTAHHALTTDPADQVINSLDGLFIENLFRVQEMLLNNSIWI